MDITKLAIMGSFAAYLAPLAIAATFWRQIYNWFLQVKGYLILTATFRDTDSGNAMLSLFWKEFDKIGKGSGSYGMRNAFVIPKSRVEKIGIETVGNSMVFRKGWRFLFVTTITDQNNRNHVQGVTVTTFKGMFDLKSLFLKAVDNVNEMSKATSTRSRYEVRHRFGRASSKSEEAEISEESPKEVVTSQGLTEGYKILGYSPEEIGTPAVDKPFSYLAYTSEVLQYLDTVKHWIASETWFKSKQLPWTIGARLEGPRVQVNRVSSALWRRS